MSELNNANERISQLELEKARLEAALEAVNRQIDKLADELQMLKVDDKTGFDVRGSFFEQIREYKATNGENSLHFVFIDLDGLKMINDEINHSAGDEFLEVAAVSMAVAYGNENSEVMFTRLGGDEFSIAIPKSYLSLIQVYEKSVEMSEKFKADMSEVLLDYGREDLSNSIGMSVGIGESIEEADFYERIVKRLGGSAVATAITLSEDQQALIDNLKNRGEKVDFHPRVRK